VANFVIVHGAWGGGWEWSAVARLLRSFGHDVYTPTLTGLGERNHLGPNVGLRTHIEDIAGVLEFEDLRDVVLCGASYGGMAVTGAADRAPERIALVVYIDALVPENGESGLDLLPTWFGELVRNASRDRGQASIPVPDAVLPPKGLITEEAWDSYVARLRDQPVATFTETIRLAGQADALPRAFVRCTASRLNGDPIEAMASRARYRGWTYRELATPHDSQLFDPVGTANLLNELAADINSGKR
jgi:pimeloyl-ACP methyl ester carboxylesterase